MASPTILPVTIPPRGDDLRWKVDVVRALGELIAKCEAQQSEIDALKGRVH